MTVVDLGDGGGLVPGPDLRPLGVIALELARVELARDVREIPRGSDRGPAVDLYAPRCVRAGRWYDAIGLEWCARFASEITWRAWVMKHALTGYGNAPLAWDPSALPREPPFSLREAVAELVTDAKRADAWRELVAGESPSPGDLLVFGRNGHDPRIGGEGHVGFFDPDEENGAVKVISGNVEDALVRGPVLAGQPWVGWITL
jgi:hypothetical protein